MTEVTRVQDLKAHEKDILNASLGQMGGVYISGTDAVTPPAGKVFVTLFITETTTIAALSGNIAGLTGLTAVAANTIIHGRFTSVTLTSGALIAYYGI